MALLGRKKNTHTGKNKQKERNKEKKRKGTFVRSFNRQTKKKKVAATASEPSRLLCSRRTLRRALSSLPDHRHRRWGRDPFLCLNRRRLRLELRLRGTWRHDGDRHHLRPAARRLVSFQPLLHPRRPSQAAISQLSPLLCLRGAEDRDAEPARRPRGEEGTLLGLGDIELRWTPTG